MAQRADQPLLWIDHLPVYPLCGAEGEGSDDGNKNGDGSSNSSGGNGNGSQSGSGGNGNQGGQSAAQETVTKADYDALMARMSQADKNAAAAQARVKELEGASQSELEKAQNALAEANKKVEELSTRQSEMVVSNAFLTVKGAPTWHSTSAALKLLDRSTITVEDDGTVKGMEAAVNKLKADHPYLVKTDDKQGDQQQNNGRQSGSSNNGGGGGGKGGNDRKELEKRFPALRGR